MTTLLTKCVTLAIVLTQTSCYPLVSPKIFGQSLTPSSRAWSNIVPYPFHAYQPSIPLQYMRYYGDPYYPTNLQNSDYYFTHDSYDDGDYYTNILYYLPSGRRNPYYEQAMIDPVEEMPDYDDDSVNEDSVSKSQRDWWLEKNVASNEDIDIRQLNRVDDLYANSKSNVGKLAAKSVSKNSRKNVPKTRYGGIDGFGRKKDQEQVYGNYRPSARKEERTWVYGKPVHYEREEDTVVRDLKSLPKNTPAKDDDKKKVDFSLSNWASGNDKRSGGKAGMSLNKENLASEDKSANTLKSAKQSVNGFSIYDEGGQEFVPQSNLIETNWKDYAPEQQTSVFDTIKTLLALEDRVNEVSQDMKTHKLLKRKPPAYKPSTQIKNKPLNKDRSRTQSSSTTSPASKNAPSEVSEVTSSPAIRTNKRSAPAETNEPPSYYNNEDSLVRELSAVRHQGS